jgi:hypothetical protein
MNQLSTKADGRAKNESFERFAADLKREAEAIYNS